MTMRKEYSYAEVHANVLQSYINIYVRLFHTSVAHCERHRCESGVLLRRGNRNTLKSLKLRLSMYVFSNIRVGKYLQLQLRQSTSSSRGCRYIHTLKAGQCLQPELRVFAAQRRVTTVYEIEFVAY